MIMNSPLRRLRDLLSFKPDEPAVSLHDILTGLGPLATLERLTGEALPEAGRETNLHMRLKRLEEIRQTAEQVLPELEIALTRSVLPLPLDATTSALHIDNFLKALAQGYHALARQIARSSRAQAQGKLFQRAAERALEAIGRRHLLAYRAYAQPSPSSWLLAHKLYGSAAAHFPENLDGIRNAYCSILLFAWFEPARLHRSDLDTALDCARRLAPQARLAQTTADNLSEAPAEHRFLVNPEDGSAGHALGRLPAGTPVFGSYLVDGSAVLDALDHSIAGHAGEPAGNRLDAPPAVLQALRVALAGRSARRFSRTRFRPRADLVVGLDRVIAFLDGLAYTRRSLDAAHQRDDTLAPSEWSLIDESPDGFLLRFIKGEKWQVGVGDIVALQPRESSKVHVCLVRRITTIGSRLEIGLQMLSPQVSAVDVTTGEKTVCRAIFLHRLPAYGKFPGLILPPGRLPAGQTVRIGLPGRPLEKRIGKCIDANDGLEFVALDTKSD